MTKRFVQPSKFLWNIWFVPAMWAAIFLTIGLVKGGPWGTLLWSAPFIAYWAIPSARFARRVELSDNEIRARNYLGLRSRISWNDIVEFRDFKIWDRPDGIVKVVVRPRWKGFVVTQQMNDWEEFLDELRRNAPNARWRGPTAWDRLGVIGATDLRPRRRDRRNTTN